MISAAIKACQRVQSPTHLLTDWDQRILLELSVELLHYSLDMIVLEVLAQLNPLEIRFVYLWLCHCR